MGGVFAEIWDDCIEEKILSSRISAVFLPGGVASGRLVFRLESSGQVDLMIGTSVNGNCYFRLGFLLIANSFI